MRRRKYDLSSVPESRTFRSPAISVFDVAGFRPGNRPTFLLGKVGKTIDAQSGKNK